MNEKQQGLLEGLTAQYRGLRKLYLGTQAEIERAVRALAERSYEQLLDTEQLAIGWGDI